MAKILALQKLPAVDPVMAAGSGSSVACGVVTEGGEGSNCSVVCGL
jgi:hypothetical protein